MKDKEKLFPIEELQILQRIDILSKKYANCQASGLVNLIWSGPNKACGKSLKNAQTNFYCYFLAKGLRVKMFRNSLQVMLRKI